MFIKKITFPISKPSLLLSLTVAGTLLYSCKKLVAIDPPADSITTSEAFANDNTATNAINGIYSSMINTQSSINFASGGVTILAGLSSDEFNYLGTDYLPFYNCSLLPDNINMRVFLWDPIYSTIYKANACIEGLTHSGTLSAGVKKQLLGEAEFLRAFSYFYLINLFGDAPLLTSTNWQSNAPLARTSATDIYKQIVSDLTDAQNLLTSDYALFNNERIRATKWAAAALLSRVYLYTKDYQKASDASSSVISSALFNLPPPSQVFLRNNSEAIWQLQPSNKLSPFAVGEAYNLIPSALTRNYPPSVVSQYYQFFIPKYALSQQLLNTFDSSDLRKSSWCDTTGSLNGTNYYYASKYKIYQGTAGGDIPEYYTVLRLAEQYLIRAESYARQSKLSQSVSDINQLRVRAGLLPLSDTLNASQVFAEIARERKIEFFCEWGHRWFDLKRRGEADSTLGAVKGNNWKTTDQLYPIPITEIQKDPNLKQNAGYN